MARSRGYVRWFSPTKQYGFLIPETDNTRDVFIHVSELEKVGLKTLTEGQAVDYDEVRSREGKLKAANISLVD